MPAAPEDPLGALARLDAETPPAELALGSVWASFKMRGAVEFPLAQLAAVLWNALLVRASSGGAHAIEMRLPPRRVAAAGAKRPRGDGDGPALDAAARAMAAAASNPDSCPFDPATGLHPGGVVTFYRSGRGQIVTTRCPATARSLVGAAANAIAAASAAIAAAAKPLAPAAGGAAAGPEPATRWGLEEFAVTGTTAQAMPLGRAVAGRDVDLQRLAALVEWLAGTGTAAPQSFMSEMPSVIGDFAMSSVSVAYPGHAARPAPAPAPAAAALDGPPRSTPLERAALRQAQEATAGWRLGAREPKKLEVDVEVFADPAAGAEATAEVATAWVPVVVATSGLVSLKKNADPADLRTASEKALRPLLLACLRR